jgi:alkylation response protein AidB-like acyl-CoA dehydrogenase
MYDNIGRSLGTDFFRIADQLSPAELDLWRRARDFVDDEVLGVINGYWERAEFPWPLVERLAKLGLVGDGIEGYDCPPMSPIATGLVHMELNRGDGSLGTFLGVQALDRSARFSGAEAPLAPGDGSSAQDRRVRVDRAQTWFGRRLTRDLGPAPGRRMGPEWTEEVDWQRHDR